MIYLNDASRDASVETGDAPRLMNIVFGWWSSRLVSAAVNLGIVDALCDVDEADADSIAARCKTHPDLTYRFLRSLANIGVLEERPERRFRLSPMGALLRNTPGSMRAVARWETAPAMFDMWSKLEDVVRDGAPTGFERAFGMPAWQYFDADAELTSMMSGAMTSYSALEEPSVAATMAGVSIPANAVICDIGGGHGKLLGSVLAANERSRGIVFDSAPVIDSVDRGQIPGDVADRITFVPGDFLEAVPAADVYLMKHIVHDWNDEHVARILRNVRASARSGATLLIFEALVPGPQTPALSKLLDVHLLLAMDGHERTRAEFETLLEASGWHLERTIPAPSSELCVIEAKATA